MTEHERLEAGFDEAVEIMVSSLACPKCPCNRTCKYPKFLQKYDETDCRNNIRAYLLRERGSEAVKALDDAVVDSKLDDATVQAIALDVDLEDM